MTVGAVGNMEVARPAHGRMEIHRQPLEDMGGDSRGWPLRMAGEWDVSRGDTDSQSPFSCQGA